MISRQAANSASAASSADTVDLLRLPAGALVVGGEFRGDDIDTGTEALVVAALSWL